eukprot:275227_1
MDSHKMTAQTRELLKEMKRKDEYLIFGYIREVAIKQYQMNIPSSIIGYVILYRFYGILKFMTNKNDQRMQYITENHVQMTPTTQYLTCNVLVDVIVDVDQCKSKTFEWCITMNSLPTHFHPGFIPFEDNIDYDNIGGCGKSEMFSPWCRGCSLNCGNYADNFDAHCRTKYCPETIINNINYKDNHRVYLNQYNKKWEHGDVFKFIINGNDKTCRVFLNDIDLGIIWKNIPNKIIPGISCSKTVGDFTVS